MFQIIEGVNSELIKVIDLVKVIPDSRFYNQDRKVIISHHFSLLGSPLKTSWNLWPNSDLVRYLKETFFEYPLKTSLSLLGFWVANDIDVSSV